MSATRGLYHLPSKGQARRGASRRPRMLRGGRHADDGGAGAGGRWNRSGPAPAPPVAARATASVCEGRRAQPRARPPVLLARRREDVEHDAAHAERAAAVRHARRRLPEVAGLHVMLDAVLDADPFALEAHAPLLVGCACTGETAPGSSVTTESIACTPGNTRALTPGASCRSMPPVFR